jgi:hypothetical protein
MEAVMYPRTFTNESRLTDAEIRRIQVYLGADLGNVATTLKVRQSVSANDQSRNVVDGRGSIVNTTTVQTEIIEVETGTPGVIVARGYEWVDVDFGGDVILTFRKAEKSWNTLYRLAAARKGGRSLEISNPTGTRWYLQSDEDIDVSSRTVNRTTETKAPGKTVR